MKNIWVSVSGQIAQQRKVETLANNIANANTPGFKKDDLVFKEHLTALNKGSTDIDIPTKDWSPDDFYRTQGAQNAHVVVDGSYTNFQQGQLVPTSNPLDLALNGQGFFEVLTPNGIRYTRTGNFTISKDGNLVTDQNFKVLGATEDAAPKEDKKDLPESSITSRFLSLPVGEKVSIGTDGQIFSKSGVIGKISVVEFNDIQAIKKEGNSLYINNNSKNIKREGIKTSVNQGFVEGSNVNAISEMSELIRAHRHFENMQKAIRTYDTIQGKAVNDIAKF